MTDSSRRRPLASRNTRAAQTLAAWIAATGIGPNAISRIGILFALVGGAAFAGLAVVEAPAPRIGLLLLAALGCQLRLLCNLLDGMVAIEGGRGGPDGPFWNEAPDRLSDIFILVGFGIAAGSPALGWAAACLAVFAAYVRELGVSHGLAPDFGGPMAKPHRMAAVTLAASVAVAAEAFGQASGPILKVALWAVALGTVVTILLRSWRQVAALRRSANG